MHDHTLCHGIIHFYFLQAFSTEEIIKRHIKNKTIKRQIALKLMANKLKCFRKVNMLHLKIMKGK